MEQLKRVVSLVDRFVNNGELDLWSVIAFGGDKNKALCRGLLQAVRFANDALAKELIDKNFEKLLSYLKNSEYPKQIKGFYEFKGWLIDEQQLNRLSQHSIALVETAYASILAKRAIFAQEMLPSFIKQCQKAISSLSSGASQSGAFVTIEQSITEKWSKSDPEELIEQGFTTLGSGESLLAKYWSLYFLEQHIRMHLPETRKVKAFGYVSNKGEKSYINYINLQKLQSNDRQVIIEHPENALMPLGKDLLEGIKRAWQQTGQVSVCWVFSAGLEIFQEGDSLSAAVAAALATLSQNSHYDADRVILGAISKDDNGSLIPVGHEYKKLQTAIELGVKLAVVIKSVISGVDSINRITSSEIASLQDKGLVVKEISTISEAIEFVTIKKCPLYNVPTLAEHFISRKEVVKEIKAKLLSNQTVELTGSQKVGLQGMGGIGKTWLAKELANLEDPELWKAFPQGIVWSTIGYTADETYIKLRQEEIIEALTGERPIIGDLLQATNKLRKALEGKSCLLILDDIWSKSQYEAFNVLSKNSKMLLTTRNAQLLGGVSATTHSIEKLTEFDAIKMLAEYASEKHVEKLPVEAHRIATKWCRCLPFGLGLCGSLVKVSKWRWKDLLDSLEEADINDLKNTYFDGIDERIASNSIKALGEQAKYYQELAAFREDSKITSKAIVVLLSQNHSLVERKIRPIIEKFVDYGLLLKVGKDIYELHDLLYLYLVNQSNKSAKELSFNLLEAYKASYGEWYKATEDPYFVEHAAYHFKKAGRDNEFKQILLDFNYIQAKLNAGDINSLLADYYLEDQETKLTKRTLTLSTYALKKDRSHLISQLASQLIGRLTKQDLKSNNINRLLGQIKKLNNIIWLESLTNSLASPLSPLIATLIGHFDRVTTVGMIEDGKRIISGSYDGTVKIWDIESQYCIATLEGHSAGVTSVGVIGNGKKVISGSYDGTVKIWDIENQYCIATLEGHSAGVIAVGVIGDGKRVVSGSKDNTIKIWDIKGKECIVTLNGHSAGVTSVGVIGNGKKVISGSYDGTVKIWDVESQYCIATLEGHSAGVTTVGVVNNKRIISGSLDNTVKIWDIENLSCIATLKDHLHSVMSVGVMNDKRIISGSLDNTVKIWDIENLSCIATLKSHSVGVTAVGVVNDKRIISGSSDKTIKIWEVDNLICAATLEGHSAYVNAVKIIGNSERIISGSSDKTIKVWNLDTQICIATLEGHSARVTAIEVIEDGKRVISSSYDKTIKIWDIESQSCISTLGGHLAGVTAVEVLGNGKRIISGSWDRTIKIWDIESQSCIAMLEGHSDSVTAVEVIVDSKKVVSGSLDNTIKIWDIENQSCIATLEGHSAGVIAVGVIGDGKRVISSSWDNTLRIWSLDSRICIAMLEGHSGSVFAIGVMGQSNRVISASSDKTLRIWDLDTYKEIACFYGEKPFTSCTVGENGLIVAGDNMGQVYSFRLRGLEEK